MNKPSTKKTIEVLSIVRAYYAGLTAGYPEGRDREAIGDIMCSEIANSCLMAIKALESQESREGNWISKVDFDDTEYGYTCDICGNWARDKSNYCPSCGARMVATERKE